jgi:hypothetical protein
MLHINPALAYPLPDCSVFWISLNPIRARTKPGTAKSMLKKLMTQHNIDKIPRMKERIALLLGFPVSECGTELFIFVTYHSNSVNVKRFKLYMHYSSP